MKNFRGKCVKCLRLISVEPTMWFYMMAFMTTSVIEQAFFVHKACRVDHGLSKEICRNLTENKDLNTKVQITVSKFHQWNNIASHVFPIILAFFIGNWSDRHGRKLLLILGLFGKLIYSLMIIVNSLILSWGINMIIYTASIPSTLFGADVAIFASCFAYISDVSTLEQRTLRVTILDAVYLSAMPMGIALGSYLYNHVVNFSFTIMFAINSSLLILSIIYSLLNLKWQTNVRQEPLKGTNVCLDFFDKKHVIATIKTLAKRRNFNGRQFLWILLLGMMLYTFQRDEKQMSFLYTTLIFKWNVANFSTFRTFQSTLYVIAMLLGVPLMSKFLKLRDTSIIVIGTLSHAGARVIFSLAKIPELFYFGSLVGALGPIVAPVLRSMISKVVPAEERGKIFSILSVFDNAVPLFSGVLYSQLYNATIDTMPYSIYWLTAASQIAVLLLVLIIHFSNGSQHLDHESLPIEPSLSRTTSNDKLESA
ncbi:thymic stromal cotransporter homolog [Belonocnema kinseyi]|uniref:thymic stromal cotransporter homolog n=1 Tax=Belonocnema kinseyi TaxID=2817044 RepID=UPI00143DD54B|nr:thymic stromal cotransporter homolog [Belonocnema kinseyi]